MENIAIHAEEYRLEEVANRYDYELEGYDFNGIHYTRMVGQLSTKERLLMLLVTHQCCRDFLPSAARIEELSNTFYEELGKTLGEFVKDELLGILQTVQRAMETGYTYACNEEFAHMAEWIFNDVRNLIVEADYSAEYEYYNYLRRHCRESQNILTGIIVKECRECPEYQGYRSYQEDHPNEYDYQDQDQVYGDE